MGWKFWASSPAAPAASAEPIPSPAAPAAPTPPPQSVESAQQQQQQLTTATRQPLLNTSQKLFLAGSCSFLFSVFVTRRTLRRRKLGALPPYYTSSTNHQLPVNGAMEAIAALNIASLNVFSVAAMTIGGALWKWDINSVEDLRRKIRGGLGVDGSGRDEKDVEEEFEEWVVDVLARKEDKEEARKRRGGGEEGAVRFNERGRER